MKVPFVIYADLESLLEKMTTSHSNPEKSSTTKINKHTPSGYTFFTHCSFDTTKNKLDYYRAKNYLKNFYLDLREHATKIINYEKKKWYHYQRKKRKCIVDKKSAIYAKKDLVLIITIKNTIKQKIIVIILENTEVLLMTSAI